MLTSKTSFHKITSENTAVIYRDLTVLELSYLEGIKNDVMRFDMAAKICITEPESVDNIAWPILQQVGQSAIYHSTRWVNDKKLFEIIVREYRQDISSGTSPLGMIRQILEVFPGQSITELMKLTWKDLVEITCLAEAVSGKKIFNVAGGPTVARKGSKLANTQAFEEDNGKSLQEKMNALNSVLGGIPK